MKVLDKVKDKITDKALDVQDWFYNVGYNFFEVEKQIQQLDLEGLLPAEVCDVLNQLEGNSGDAEKKYYEAKNEHEETIENRRSCNEILADKEREFAYFKSEHHGSLAKIMYNITPLRFFRVGREYQQLRKEIKVLRKESDYLRKYSNIAGKKFETASENRREASRAEVRYKKIVVEKANIYRDTWKLIKEYTEATIKKDDKIENLFGNDIKKEIENYMNSVIENWYYMDNIKAEFDVKKVGKIITKLNRGDKLKKDEVNFAEKLKKETKTESRTTGRMEMDPPVGFSKDGIDRNVVERMLKNERDDCWKGASTEQYMAALAIVEIYKDNKEKGNEEADKVLNGKNKEIIRDYASKGIEMATKYMKMSDEERTESGMRINFDRFSRKYNDIKEKIEEEEKKRTSEKDKEKPGEEPED